MFPNLTWPYDSEFPRSNWNFKFPVSMTRRRNHMFENTSCPCFHQNLTNVMLRSYFIFGLNSIFYCFELIYQKFPTRQNTKGNQNKDKIEPECIHFSPKRHTGMLTKDFFMSIHFWEEKSTWCRIKLTYWTYMQICYWKLQRVFDPMYISIISGLLGYLGIISP